MVAYNDPSRHKNTDSPLTGLETLPFLLAQSSLTPYILLAATTSALDLARWLSGHEPEKMKSAVETMAETALVVPVPELMETVLSFFDKFAPLFLSIHDYLNKNAVNQKPAKS